MSWITVLTVLSTGAAAFVATAVSWYFAQAARERREASGASQLRSLGVEGLATKGFPRVEGRADRGSVLPVIRFDLRGAVLRDEDLSNIDLTGALLSQADLSRTSLRHARLLRADLAHASLVDVDLGGADLQAAVLTGANLSGARLVDANLLEASLREAVLVDADLSRALLVGADLRGATLLNANVSGADLTDTLLDMKTLQERAAGLVHDSRTVWPVGVDPHEVVLPSTRLTRVPQPLYIAVDMSASMSGSQAAEVRLLLEDLRTALLARGADGPWIWLSLITFSDHARVEIPLTPIERVAIPELVAGGGTNYTAALQTLREEIVRDKLRAASGAMARPLVALITDGSPTNPDWRTAREELEATPSRPRILAFGIGNVDARTLAELGTAGAFEVNPNAGSLRALRVIGDVLLEAVAASVGSLGAVDASGVLATIAAEAFRMVRGNR